MNKSLALRAAVVLGVFLLMSGRASAASFTLNQSGCCGVGPFGSVALTQAGPNSVDVTVTLNPGVGFVDTGNGPPGNHPDFAWNLLGDPAGVSVLILQDGNDDWTYYDVHATPVTMSNSYGTYGYALYCNGVPDDCGPGGSDPNPGPLKFRVTLATGLLESAFVANAAGSYFVADIINGAPNGNGATGLIGATAPDRVITAVPEPVTLLLVGAGLVGVTSRARRKARKAN